ncbi:uncharacterized protein F5891DRAFT_1053872 [Suillus fuscotomentosus]|uniref:Uncharacterized protein n=1 Tax=Suillus fuscotomentosus TaxID=1912939 RepID=A0AAD4HHJ8_9AGAM|nr:uncharacterized protein F5891DRAFT_1053872 [Suillus fuscotomentosus]KAG1896441.1 hypothetical protein F5891DRAFT_1053872 [Suillus fuscotomentosus]
MILLLTCLCFLPVRLIIWCFGFRSRGVKKVHKQSAFYLLTKHAITDSVASQYQSSHDGGNVSRGSGFAKLQLYASTTPIVASMLISLLAYTGAVIILGREWCIQLGDWCHFVSNGW